MSFLQSGIRCCNFLNDNKERAVYVFIYKNDAADEIIARVNFNNSGEDPTFFFYEGCSKELKKEIKEWKLKTEDN